MAVTALPTWTGGNGSRPPAVHAVSLDVSSQGGLGRLNGALNHRRRRGECSAGYPDPGSPAQVPHALTDAVVLSIAEAARRPVHESLPQTPRPAPAPGLDSPAQPARSAERPTAAKFDSRPRQQCRHRRGERTQERRCPPSRSRLRPLHQHEPGARPTRPRRTSPPRQRRLHMQEGSRAGRDRRGRPAQVCRGRATRHANDPLDEFLGGQLP